MTEKTWLEIYPSQFVIHSFVLNDNCANSKWLNYYDTTICWPIHFDTILTHRGDVFGRITTKSDNELVVQGVYVDPPVYKYTPIESASFLFDIEEVRNELINFSWIIPQGKFDYELIFTPYRIYPDSISNNGLKAFRKKISPHDTSGIQDDFYECSWFISELKENLIIGLTHWWISPHQLFIVKNVENEQIIANQLNHLDENFIAISDSDSSFNTPCLFKKIQNISDEEIELRFNILRSIKQIEDNYHVSDLGGHVDQDEYNEISQDSILKSLNFSKNSYKFQYSDGFIIEGTYKLSSNGNYIILNNGLVPDDYIRIDWSNKTLRFDDKVRLAKTGRYYKYNTVKRIITF